MFIIFYLHILSHYDETKQAGVLVNGFVLSLTSELVPRMVYRYHYSVDGTLNGYVDWSLAIFDVRDFTEQERPELVRVGFNVTHCR